MYTRRLDPSVLTFSLLPLIINSILCPCVGTNIPALTELPLRFPVAGSFTSIHLGTTFPLVPPTRVPKRHTTGRLVRSMTFSGQHTKWKHNKWVEVGVNNVRTSSWPVTHRLLLTKLENIILTIITTTLLLSPLWLLLLVRLGDYIVNLCSFYFYNLIGKLTTFFQLQEFSLRNTTVASSTTTARRCPRSLNQRLGTFSLKLQHYG